jgi:hypothetical protein
VLDGGVPQPFLGAVALVDEVVADPQAAANLPHRGAVVALVGEGIEGQVEEVGVGYDRCHGRGGYLTGART